MGSEIDVAAVLRLLGHAGERPLSARRHRSLLATRHGFDQSSAWDWHAQALNQEAIAGIVFSETPITVRTATGDARAQSGEAIFLHPQRAARVNATAGGVGVCVWLPWADLAEVETGGQPPGAVITSTPLLAGLRAFLTSLLTQQETPTLYTDYLVERIVIEMAFGVLLESVPASALGARDERPVDRARALMLLRRADSEFGVAELASELHMSTRHVQRLFAAENSAPADELRGMRIELANELLGDPAYDPLTVAEIALHAGFATSGALRRAFSARGLPLPTRARGTRATSYTHPKVN